MGIIRVSQPGDREGDGFASPPVQRERIQAACNAAQLQLLEIFDETDKVSGGAELSRRPGLGPALAMVEAGEAEVIVGAYFDRLFRSLDVQRQVIDRAEAAGGQVLAVDVGRVSSRTAGEWLSGTMLGTVSEYYRRSVKERSAAAQQRAIDRGVPPWPRLTEGYDRASDGRFVPNANAPVVLEAFERRAGGASIERVRDFLREHGISITYRRTQSLLASRVVLGEIHFGRYRPNLEAHDPIVPRDVWDRVQRVKVSRGRRAKSDRLLARLGVLRCGTCGGRMVVGTAHHGRYPLYRCSPTSDCPRRTTISAVMVERFVEDAVRAAIADEEGRAQVGQHVREAEQELARREAAYANLVELLTGHEDLAGTREKLAQARDVCDEARNRLEALGGDGTDAVLTVVAGRDWDRLELEERRGLIRATVARVTVAPGRETSRIGVRLFGQ